jgi:hypothetical protein
MELFKVSLNIEKAQNCFGKEFEIKVSTEVLEKFMQKLF